jgi:hypothetical protein
MPLSGVTSLDASQNEFKIHARPSKPYLKFEKLEKESETSPCSSVELSIVTVSLGPQWNYIHLF